MRILNYCVNPRAVLVAAVVFLVRPAHAQTNVETLALERGQAIVAKAFGVLSSNLVAALNQGGVSNALQFCSVKALSLTAAVTETNDVTLRRVSHKARNPKNKAAATDLEALVEFRSSLTPGKTSPPLVRVNDSGGATFYAPIVLNTPLCLNCHGQPDKDIKPENVALIQKLYPRDEATGFSLGELRGLWRIEFQPKALRASPQ